MKIDVAVCTYQSEKYLDKCLTSVEKSVPINKLIVVDHYSTDRTIEIAKKHNAEIYFENVGLGYARQIAIDHVETPIFMFLDSDVVFFSYDWFEKAFSLMGRRKNGEKIGAVVVFTPVIHNPQRQKYADFWWKMCPWKKEIGFLPQSTLYLKSAIEGIKIPSILGSYEQVYIEHYMRKRGYTYAPIEVKGRHFYDFPDKKASWMGAGDRLFSGLRRDTFTYVIFRQALIAPLKAVPPAVFMRDPLIILWNTRYWFGYLKGWLHPEEYTKMKRSK